MIVDALMGLIHSWFMGVVNILPDFSPFESGTMGPGLPDPVGKMVESMAYSYEWGIPVPTLLNVTLMVINIELAAATVMIGLFLYNKLVPIPK